MSRGLFLEIFRCTQAARIDVVDGSLEIIYTTNHIMLQFRKLQLMGWPMTSISVSKFLHLMTVLYMMETTTCLYVLLSWSHDLRSHT